MDIISYGKAGKALRDVKKLDEQVVAPLAESRFPTVDARLDWLEGQADKIKVENSLQVDLSKGTFTDTEFVNGKIQLKKVGEMLTQSSESLVPVMTSPNTPSPIEITSNTGLPAAAFDGSDTSAWQTNRAGLISYLTINFGINNRKIVNRILVDGRNTINNGTNQSLSGFSLFGSNNNIDFDLLLTENAAGTIKEFSFENDSAYQYFKFSNFTSSQVGIRDIKMYGLMIAETFASQGSYESPIIDLGEGWHETKLVDVVKQVRNGGYTNNIIPTMTSNTAPSGEASASSINGSSWDAWRGFDGTTTAWMSNAAVAWIAYDFKEPKKIGKYTISGDSTTSRNPKKWTFEGWDGSSWVILDQQELDYILGVSDVEFMVDTPGFYTKYRINILLNNGATNSAIREIKMMELLPGTDSKLEISASADGTTFNSYAPVDPAAPAQGRYVKIRATLSSQPQPAEVNTYQYDQAAENKVTLNAFTEAAGDLKLKKNYSYALEEVSVEAEGKIIQTKIPRTQFSKIHTLEIRR